jgi:hypothetical protein
MTASRRAARPLEGDAAHARGRAPRGFDLAQNAELFHG